MHTVDNRDRVTELTNIPQSSVGAPCPLILASEQELLVAYFQEDPAAWDGKSVRVVAPDSLGEPAVLIRFLRACAKMFGPPGDEAFSGHPLAQRGLHPYGAFESEVVLECRARGIAQGLRGLGRRVDRDEVEAAPPDACDGGLELAQHPGIWGRDPVDPTVVAQGSRLRRTTGCG